MSDLTDANLEAMEKRCEAVRTEAVRENSPWNPWFMGQAEILATDLSALIAALREARGEREEARRHAMLYQQRHEDALAERDAALMRLSQHQAHHRVMLEIGQELIKFEQMKAENLALREAVEDLLGGWRYIRQAHGDLYGVGWDRAQHKGEIALAETPLTAAEVARVKRLEKVAEAAKVIRDYVGADLDAALAELDAGEGPC